MTDHKCEKCGGIIMFEPDAAKGVCSSCGAEYALPEPDVVNAVEQDLQEPDEGEAAEQEQTADDVQAAEQEPAAQKKGNKKALAATLIGLACIAVLILVICLITPNARYNKALRLEARGEHEAAIAALEDLNGYKDSADQLVSIKKRYHSELIAGAKAGDIVFFGSYEQDNDLANGKEDIEWLVLDRDGDRLFVLSLHALDGVPYNDTLEDVTWQGCSLRRWLNVDFLYAAFTAEEQAMIPPVTVKADPNPTYITDPGSDTLDRVFLLSIPEAETYFSSPEERICVPTAYAVSKGITASEPPTVIGPWWLRTPGYAPCCAEFVAGFGAIAVHGDFVDEHHYSVRPAMWIDPVP